MRSSYLNVGEVWAANNQWSLSSFNLSDITEELLTIRNATTLHCFASSMADALRLTVTLSNFPSSIYDHTNITESLPVWLHDDRLPWKFTSG